MLFEFAAGALDHAFGDRYFPPVGINQCAAAQGLAGEGLVWCRGCGFLRAHGRLLVGRLLHLSQSR